MTLDAYRAKRDFTTSPEPAGALRRRRHAGPGFFCVQKHLASHLHYDVRLEHEGVLLSWAVPKGPSLDPADKRLAMQVEDHPLEYGDFEGVIPDGYGAGVVMLWDRGTWEPEVEDVGAALERGDLKFRLDGFKLKGSWALVRTRGYGAGRPGATGDTRRSWLLIKHRDEWAGALDIGAFAPLSVKSGGDFADILADHPSFWQSTRPARGGQLQRIVERALAPQAGRTAATPPVPPSTTGRAPRARPPAAAPRRAPTSAGRRKRS